MAYDRPALPKNHYYKVTFPAGGVMVAVWKRRILFRDKLIAQVFHQGLIPPENIYEIVHRQTGL